jgi:hypothetical protein
MVIEHFIAHLALTSWQHNAINLTAAIVFPAND